MNYLTILDYTNGKTIIIEDPGFYEPDFNYEDYILEEYDKIEMYYMVGPTLEIKL